MRTIELGDAQNQLTTLIEEIGQPGQEGIEIMSQGERLAVLLPPSEYERYQRVVEQIFARAREAFERIQDRYADLSDEEFAEIERELEETVEEVRREIYERRLNSTATSSD